MDVREWSNRHPGITASLVASCVLICGLVIYHQTRGNQHAILFGAPDHYFTVDDGKTYFRASGANIAPFDHSGATAVRAYVFDCDGNKFVGYVERYTPEARAIEMSGKPVPMSVEMYGREVKKPGERTWTSVRTGTGLASIFNVKCPAGSTELPKPVEP